MRLTRTATDDPTSSVPARPAHATPAPITPAPAPRIPATVRRSTILDAPADLVWAAVGTPQAFRFVTRGLVDWQPLRGRTEAWREGEAATGWLFLFGLIPFSRHRIRIVEIDDSRRILRSDESGGAIRSWQHDILVEAVADDTDRTHYTDVIRIDAGPLTPLVAAFAGAFYRERQRRWRVVAELLDATIARRDSVTGHR